MYNSADLEAIVSVEILFDSIWKHSLDEFLLLEINAASKCLLEDEVNHFLVIDQYFIVDTNFIKERSSSYSLVEMRQYIGDIFHKEMFCFHVIEAKESEILIDREEERSMSLG